MRFFPLAYFGNIAYFRALVRSATPHFSLNEKYQKQSYRNRCEIIGANGKLSLTVPVIKTKGSHSLMSDIEISYAENWQKNHWKTIESAYGKAPFFEFYEEDIKKLIFSECTHLYELNRQILEKCFFWLDFSQEILLETKEAGNQSYEFQLTEKKAIISDKHASYYQVFENKFGFFENLSIVDLILNEGPKSQLIVFQ